MRFLIIPLILVFLLSGCGMAGSVKPVVSSEAIKTKNSSINLAQDRIELPQKAVPVALMNQKVLYSLDTPSNKSVDLGNSTFYLYDLSNKNTSETGTIKDWNNDSDDEMIIDNRYVYRMPSSIDGYNSLYQIDTQDKKLSKKLRLPSVTQLCYFGAFNKNDILIYTTDTAKENNDGSIYNIYKMSLSTRALSPIIQSNFNLLTHAGKRISCFASYNDKIYTLVNYDGKELRAIDSYSSSGEFIKRIEIPDFNADFSNNFKVFGDFFYFANDKNQIFKLDGAKFAKAFENENLKLINSNRPVTSDSISSVYFLNSDNNLCVLNAKTGNLIKIPFTFEKNFKYPYIYKSDDKGNIIISCSDTNPNDPIDPNDPSMKKTNAFYVIKASEIAPFLK